MKKKLLIIALSVFILCLGGCSIEDSDSDSLGDNTELLQTTTTPFVTTATTTPSATKDDTQTDISDTQPEILPSDEFSFETGGIFTDPDNMTMLYLDNKLSVQELGEIQKRTEAYRNAYSKLIRKYYKCSIKTSQSDSITAYGNTYYVSTDNGVRSIEAALLLFDTIFDESFVFENKTSTPAGEAPVFIEENGKLYVIKDYFVADVSLNNTLFDAIETEDGKILATGLCDLRGKYVDRTEYEAFCRFCYQNQIYDYDIKKTSTIEFLISPQPDGSYRFSENVFEKERSLTVYEDNVDYSIPTKYSDIPLDDKMISLTINEAEKYDTSKSPDAQIISEIQSLINRADSFTFRKDESMPYTDDYSFDALFPIDDYGIITQEDVNERFYEIYHPDCTTAFPPQLSVIDGRLVYNAWNWGAEGGLEDIVVHSVTYQSDSLITAHATAFYSGGGNFSYQCAEYQLAHKLLTNVLTHNEISITIAKNADGEWRILDCPVELGPDVVLTAEDVFRE